MSEILRADAILAADGELIDAECEIDDQGRIAYLGPARAQSQVTIDLTGHALMPGLVNGHAHSAMTLLRGICDDAGLSTWLPKVQQAEQQFTRDDIEVGLELAMLEMIATGTTTFADMYYWDLGLLERVRSAGMRVLAGPAVFTRDVVGFPNATTRTGAQVLDDTEALAATFADDPHISLAFSPHSPYTSPAELLTEISCRARHANIPILTHVSETHDEIARSVKLHGVTPGVFLDSLGFFEARVIAAHGVHLTPDEIELFASTGTAISHNPVSNLKLGCGIAPLPEMLAAGVPIALGTDSAASNNSLDMFEEIKLATLLHRGTHRDATAVTADQVLHIATDGGARALGFTETGSLKVGAMADIVAVDVSSWGAVPRVSLASHLVFSSRGSDVRHVFIGGTHVYAEGQHLTLDAQHILQRAAEVASRLRD